MDDSDSTAVSRSSHHNMSIDKMSHFRFSPGEAGVFITC